MADLLMDMAEHISTQGIALPAEIYRDHAPDSPDNVIVIYEYESTGSMQQVEGVNRSLQIVVRRENPGDARTKALEIYNSLKSENGIVNLTADRWCVLHLRNVPIKIKVDDKQRSYYGFNLGLTTYSD